MKTFNKILIAVLAPLTVTAIIYLLTSFKSDVIHETIQDNNITTIHKECHLIYSLNAEKNKHANHRIDKSNDENKTQHKAINEKIDKLTEIIIRIDENIKLIKRQNDYADN